MSPMLRLLLLSLVLTAPKALPAVADTAAPCTACPLPLAQDLPIEIDPGFPVTVDLLTMITKAEKDRELSSMLENLIARRTNARSLDMLAEVALNGLKAPRKLEDGPFRYALLFDVAMAQDRARILGEMLVADLNNDGQIARQELMDTLSLQRVNYVSDAFFTSDANGDNILSMEELRSAATQALQVGGGQRYARAHFAQVLDFDSDGYLTAEEYQRGLVAMGFPSL